MTTPAGTPNPQTRRGFLTRLGAVGGVSALYGGMEALGLIASPAHAGTPAFTPPHAADLPDSARARGTSVVILGAGTAGLAAAYELTKAGYDCTVLEARDRPGGRALTIRRGDRLTDTDGVTQVCRFDEGLYFNAGAARIPGHHVTLDYCRELGVAIEAMASVNADSLYYHENTPDTDYGPLAGVPVPHRQAKADLFGYMSHLLATAVGRGALDDLLSVDDAERLVAFAQDFGTLSSDNEYFGSTRRGYSVLPGAGQNPGRVDDPPPMTVVLQSRFGHRFGFEFGWDQAMMMWQPVGGMDRICAALADAVGGRRRITYNAPVTRIENTSDGVRVGYRSNGRTRTVEADYCIATIPPMVLERIPSNLGRATRDALAVPLPANTGKIGLQYGRRWWEEDDNIFGGITGTNLDISEIWYPSSGYLGRKGVVVGYYSGTYTDVPVADREARAVAQGVKIHGAKYRDELEASFSVAWPKVPYSLGAWALWPNGQDESYDHLLEPDGRVYFAGDYLTYLNPWQAGAFESARLVVTRLHERVAATAA